MASNKTHTPGPWFAADDGREIFIKGEGDFPIQIAEVVDGGDCADEMQLRADQRLIAAAPELLEALKEIVTILRHNPDASEPPRYRNARCSKIAAAAIARATGEAA